jgi:hypothetical protein
MRPAYRLDKPGKPICEEQRAMEGPDYTSLDPEERTNKLLALFSIGIGILSLCGALIPICGGIGGIAGIVFGYFGLKSESRLTARIGMAVSALALLLAMVYGFLVMLQNP